MNAESLERFLAETLAGIRKDMKRKGKGRRWAVTLFNQHAMSGIKGEGRTRRAAFDAAYRKAGPEFRAYGFAELGTPLARGNDVMWLAAFNEARAYMRHGAASATFRDHQCRIVEIRRL